VKQNIASGSHAITICQKRLLNDLVKKIK